MLRFQFLGIPFVVAPYFWFLSAFLGSSLLAGNPEHGTLLLLVWVACVFVSIVVHELGHALAARRYGLAPSIELAGMGGLTSFPGGALTRAQHIAVVCAGPAAGLTLWLVVKVFRGRVGDLGLSPFLDGDTPGSLAANEALRFLLQINLWWTVFNLLPVLPLDGGQILRDLLGPRLHGTARIISAVIGGAVCVLALLGRQYYMAVLFGFLTFNNLRGNPQSLGGGVSRN